MADRIPTGARTIQSKYAKTKALEKRAKLLRCDEVNSTQQSLLYESRLREWSRYGKYEAVAVISDARFQQLVQPGAEVLSTQWIEVDRNEKERTEENPLLPYMRSRLVARGDLEKNLRGQLPRQSGKKES